MKSSVVPQYSLSTVRVKTRLSHLNRTISAVIELSLFFHFCNILTPRAVLGKTLPEQNPDILKLSFGLSSAQQIRKNKDIYFQKTVFLMFFIYTHGSYKNV